MSHSHVYLFKCHRPRSYVWHVSLACALIHSCVCTCMCVYMYVCECVYLCVCLCVCVYVMWIYLPLCSCWLALYYMTRSHVWHATCCVCVCVCSYESTMNPRWKKDPIKRQQTENEFVPPEFVKILQWNNLYHKGFGSYPLHKTEIVPENTMLCSCSQRKFHGLNPFNCKFCEPGWV